MLRYMTAGESHGKGLLSIIDGMPAGLKIDEKFINAELKRRMGGYGRGKRMSIEDDKAEMIAGCRKGTTIGSPIGIMVGNKDHTIDELPDVKCPRPGHADLAGLLKFGFKDARSVLERASARETAARVAAGAVAKLFLKEFKIEVSSNVTMVGQAKDEKSIREEIDKAKEAGDTLGGSFEVVAEGVPAGLGSYAQWDRRLDGALARAVMSIPAVKAVSIGDGIESAGRKGSETHDAITYNAKTKGFERASNNAGGIEGGITNGSPVVVNGFMKPIATLREPLKSVDVDTKKEALAATERSDVSAVTACSVVAESSIALEIASAFLEKFGGDSLQQVRKNYEAYLESLKKM
jgi:chorismate synthase